ncbi:MAG: hypothetical protein IPK82_19735 [Polyangiaceae bacterium]|nr:hypothetical protein [Polyangiaceae bacterium]
MNISTLPTRGRPPGFKTPGVLLAPTFTLTLLLAATACGPAVPPNPPPVTVEPPTPLPTAPTQPTAAAATPPPAAGLPSLHPCVPTFIQKELIMCTPGTPEADYNAVVRAMDAVTAAGPRPKEKDPVPRELLPIEQQAETTARAFLCRAPDQADDEHATAAFDLARLYLNANHFEEAVFFLHKVAVLNPVDHPEVEYAARFLLDALAPLERARPECAGLHASLAESLEKHVCQSPGSDQRTESCAAITASKSKGVGK